MEISTDHKLVVADLDLARIYAVPGACQPSSARHTTASTGLVLNVSRLVEDKSMQKRYQGRLSSNISSIGEGALAHPSIEPKSTFSISPLGRTLKPPSPPTLL